MRYFAEIVDNMVVRVVVADSEQWCLDHLGGVWVETVDPYSDQPQTVTYCGPGFTHDPVFPERFAPEWVQPSPDPDTGVWSSYPKGAIVARNGQLWKSTIDGNVWEPGISAWHPEPEIVGVLPTWVQPTGAHDVWPLDAEVTHAGKRWRSLHPANVWEPGTNATLWLDLDAPEEPAIEAWQPWTGINADLYQIGDQVTHNGQTWQATFGNNHWEPGLFGWVVVTP